MGWPGTGAFGFMPVRVRMRFEYESVRMFSTPRSSFTPTAGAMGGALGDEGGARGVITDCGDASAPPVDLDMVGWLRELLRLLRLRLVHCCCCGPCCGPCCGGRCCSLLLPLQ